MVPYLHSLGVNAMTFHWDSAYTPKHLLELEKMLEYPVLAANVYRQDTKQLLFEPFRIFEANGLSIGVIGIASNIIQKNMPKEFWEGADFTDGIEEAALEVTDLPIALHLDHGDSFEICKQCIDGGFTSVMFDGSSLPYEENVRQTREVVEYAHARGVVVEGELGTLAGVEDEVSVDADDASYTKPEQVQDFVERTGVDSLAIAIGTSHGAFKFKPGQKPQLRFDILEDIVGRLPGFPIVLHGSSSVPQELVRKVNTYGGDMPDAIGIPEEMLREAAKSAVCKINIDSDLRLAMTATIREHFAKNPADFDPRQYLKPARAAIKELVKHKIVNVLGCDGKASNL
jgi:fructose-bisphosphate aldolase class II